MSYDDDPTYASVMKSQVVSVTPSLLLLPFSQDLSRVWSVHRGEVVVNVLCLDRVEGGDA